MTKHLKAKPATDAATALRQALGVWTTVDVDADPEARMKALDALTAANAAWRHETAWERRRATLDLRLDGLTLNEIAARIGHSVAALHQWLTGDRRASATGKFVGKTTKPAYKAKTR